MNKHQHYIELARKCGFFISTELKGSTEKWEAFYTAVRRETLLEAAEYVDRNLFDARTYASELRRMASKG